MSLQADEDDVAMKTAIRKMGNSHGVIIPKPLLAEVWAMAAAYGPNSGVVPIRTRNGKKRGEIWLARLDPTAEREIRKASHAAPFPHRRTAWAMLCLSIQVR
jgi:hypothetical protein